MQKTGRIASFFILSIFLMTSGVNAAPPIKPEIEVTEAVIKKEELLKSIVRQREKLEARIEVYDDSIEEIMNQLDENKAKSKQLKIEIKDKEYEIKQNEKDIKDKQELFDKRVRAIYMNGIIGYFEYIVEADNFGEYFERAEDMIRVVKFDSRIIKDFEAKREIIANKNKELVLAREQLDKTINMSSLAIKQLQQNKQQVESLLVQISKEEKSLAAYFNSPMRGANKTLVEMREKAERAYDEISLSKTGGKKYVFSADEVLGYAFKFLGTPYLWGGTSPETGFDFSGYVQYVLRHFNINIRRTTKQQIYDGLWIVRENLLPGDLVFFGEQGIPHHVGFYLGNNYYLHAPRTGDVIKISEMTRTDLITGVRVVYSEVGQTINESTRKETN